MNLLFSHHLYCENINIFMHHWLLLREFIIEQVNVRCFRMIKLAAGETVALMQSASPVGHPCLSVINCSHAQTSTHSMINVTIGFALSFLSCIASFLCYRRVCMSIARLLSKRLLLYFGANGGPLLLPVRVAGTCLSNYACHSCTVCSSLRSGLYQSSGIMSYAFYHPFCSCNHN